MLPAPASRVLGGVSLTVWPRPPRGAATGKVVTVMHSSPELLRCLRKHLRQALWVLLAS